MRIAGVLFRVLCISGIFIFSTCCQAAVEKITISTYYPSPYGSYEELHSNKMVIGQVDGTPPQGGLTLAPQVIGSGTDVPEGTLMYNKDEQAFTYWDGKEWREVGSKEEIWIATAHMKTQTGISNVNEWKRLEISNVESGIDPRQKEPPSPYASEDDTKERLKEKMTINMRSPTIAGSGLHRITWGGTIGVSSGGNTRTFSLRLRTNGPRTLDQIDIKDVNACDDEKFDVCGGDRPPLHPYYKETVHKEVTLAVKLKDHQEYWIDAKTEGGTKKILGSVGVIFISDGDEEFYFTVDKMGN